MNDLAFNLTLDDLLESLFDNRYCCARTGIPLRLVCPRRGDTNSPASPSLDRIDPTLGYIVGNVEVVAYMYNTCKNRFTDEEVREFAAALITNKTKDD